MLNYHHLRIFWMVAREGSLRAAGEKLHLTQPTLSAQIHQLEEVIGEPLFLRAGRRLILTVAGRMALDYAEEIFSLGAEMQAAFSQGAGSGPRRLHVGIVQSLPKLIARELLRPVMQHVPAVRLVCHEGLLDDLTLRLAQHRLDVILADEPVSGEGNLGAFNHRLGACGVSFCATRDLVRRHRRGFPESLNDAPILLPAPAMPLRRMLDDWFQRRGIQPRVVAEFDDTALMKDFAAEGLGIAPVHQATLAQTKDIYRLEPLGVAQGIRAEFHAISAERKLRNSAVRAITEQKIGKAAA